MPYPTDESLPDFVKKMPKTARDMWRQVWNSVYEQTKSEERAFRAANSQVNKYYEKDDDGNWKRKGD